MPCCCAPSCSNRSENGFHFYRFPADPTRRATWITNCGRDNWQPTAGSFLCQDHFEESQFQQFRADGKRKLVYNAVPTLFNQVTRRKRSLERPVLSDLTNCQDVYSKKVCVSCDLENSAPCEPATVTRNGEQSCSKLDHSYTEDTCDNSSAEWDHSYAGDVGVSSFDISESLSAAPVTTAEQSFIYSDHLYVKAVCASSFVTPDSSSPEADHDVVAKQKQKIKQLTQQLRMQRKSHRQLLANLKHFLNPDQIRLLKLKPKSARTVRWSNHTVKKCLQLRYATGKKGYSYLRKLGYPVPAYRTLCDRVVKAEFRPGLQLDVFEWLSVKMSSHPDTYRDCSLALDEMQLRPRIEYDKGLKSYSGYVTPPFVSDKPATHALVLILHGLTVPWKQTVAYYFTPDSMKGMLLWQVVEEVINAAHRIGLFVRVCVSDMAAANQDMWRTVGVCSTKSTLQHYIQHPSSPQHRLYFMADSPHLLKNVRNCLLNQSIILPASTVSSFHLPTDHVSLDHVHNLITIQDDKQLKLTPSLTKAHVSPGQYQKMRVNMAAAVLSHTCASALQLCVSLNFLHNDALTTAWFFDTINNWFDIMNARITKAAMFRSSADKVNTLKQVLDVVCNMKFSGRNGWKPIQTGIQLSTATVLDLYNDLVMHGKYSSLMTGRLTQDSVENLFSCIRGRGDSHPSPVHFRHNLRIISLSQYMQTSPGSCYSEDDGVYFLDFLKAKSVTAEASDEELLFLENSFTLDSSEDMLEANVCYLLAGWSVYKQKEKLHGCTDCLATICGQLTDVPADCPEAQLTMLKSYGGLSYPSPLVYSAVQVAEAIFKCCQSQLASCTDIETKLNDEFSQRFCFSGLPSCHNVLSDVVARYFRLRLHVYGKWLSEQHKAYGVQHGSRSAFCRTKIH